MLSHLTDGAALASGPGPHFGNQQALNALQSVDSYFTEQYSSPRRCITKHDSISAFKMCCVKQPASFGTIQTWQAQLLPPQPAIHANAAAGRPHYQL
jgi:hypothetical protein